MARDSRGTGRAIHISCTQCYTEAHRARPIARPGDHDRAAYRDNALMRGAVRATGSLETDFRYGRRFHQRRQRHEQTGDRRYRHGRHLLPLLASQVHPAAVWAGWG